MAKVLVLGNGAREHALAWKLAQSDLVDTVFINPGNGAPFPKPKDVSLDAASILAFCEKESINLVVVGPEDLLYNGIVDEISKHVRCFGPTKEASRLEWSKANAKSFMKSVGIPSAEYRTFTNINDATRFIEEISWDGIVVKASGLAAGKGVVVAESREEAIIAAKEMLQGKFGEASNEIIIEEMLVGEEVSALCFTDGITVVNMPLVQDHKRLLDGDQGPNTGGMGVVAPILHFGAAIWEQIEEICKRTIEALRENGICYKGVLYAGLIVTAKGVQVLEYNCRFGDPETEVLMRLLNSDLYQILLACCEGTLEQTSVQWSSNYACGVVLAASGYPLNYPKGNTITGIPESNQHTVVFHAGTKQLGNKTVTNGGRVLCVTSTAPSMSVARQRAYATAEEIHFDGKFCRTDIGLKHCLRNTVAYADSGVDINEGSLLIERIKSICDRTKLTATDYIGGFGSVVDLLCAGFGNSQIVIGMDGVGTKIAVADEVGDQWGLGYDLVGMCANDVLCHCSQPLAFLDYYVTGRLRASDAVVVIESIANACQTAGCALVGGETAEMPGVYNADQWDLAGVCVAVRDPNWPLLPLKEKISDGDVLIGVSSNGLHSNGFSLVRKIFERNRIRYSEPCPWNNSTTFGEELLRPTHIYVRSVLPVLQSGLVLGAAHITGGGLKENVNRILPDDIKAVIDCSSWQIGEIFQWLQSVGPVDACEMMRTFNCGVGMVLVTMKENVDAVMRLLNEHDEQSFVIGRTQKRSKGEDQVELVNLHKCFHGKYSSSSARKINVAILISGTGSNMVRLIESSLKPMSSCRIAVVISNVPSAKGIETARAMGIRTTVIPSKGAPSREAFEELITKELETREVELICLAGFMRILTATFVRRWAGRIINIHPSLLPSFKGAQAVPLALQHKVKLTGCTVHFVNEEVDAGEIIAQASVPVYDSDTVESLHERIKAKEHELYPDAMQLIAERFA
uniref:Trifunctional purine biosynthetic protein adenosine-3 n=1 Tax=Ascaris suum TaxID=6253 RepID=F1KUN6_ASCSU